MPVKLNKNCIIAKSNSRYTCLMCGSTEYIQGHHVIPGNDDTIIPLCAICHHSQHPKLPLGLFTNKTTQPYWYNKSASSLAKEIKAHPRTIYRRAMVHKIPRGYLNVSDEELLKKRTPSPRREKIVRPQKIHHNDNRYLIAKQNYRHARNLGFSSRESMLLQFKGKGEIEKIARERDGEKND